MKFRHRRGYFTPRGEGFGGRKIWTPCPYTLLTELTVKIKNYCAVVLNLLSEICLQLLDLFEGPPPVRGSLFKLCVKMSSFYILLILSLSDFLIHIQYLFQYVHSYLLFEVQLRYYTYWPKFARRFLTFLKVLLPRGVIYLNNVHQDGFILHHVYIIFEWFPFPHRVFISICKFIPVIWGKTKNFLRNMVKKGLIWRVSPFTWKIISPVSFGQSLSNLHCLF